ncbi:MAG: hypothetical protein KC800_28210 [Candidatus Eremiobacteraeota bacterium]|nr:hypothetical protein [Candidatus Eremiobacteraeota bacterium]
MKKTLLSWILVGTLACGAQADEALRLNKEEAKQLHALILVGELQDFGARAKSPSAYLMAAELLLDYPSREQNRSRVSELCGQARSLGRDDELVQAWADRLETRLRKSARGPKSEFVERIGILQPSEVFAVDGRFRGVWLHGDGMRLEMLDARGESVDTVFEAETLRVVNAGGVEGVFQLILLD